MFQNFQKIIIFFSTLLIVSNSQTCCSPSSSSNSGPSVNILLPVPVQWPFYGLGGLGNGLGGLGNGLGGLLGIGYYGYFTRYLGPASATGTCPAGVNINGQCWYNSIGNSKR